MNSEIRRGSGPGIRRRSGNYADRVRKIVGICAVFRLPSSIILTTALWMASQEFDAKLNIRGVVVLAGPTDLLQMETWIQQGDATSKEPSDCGIALRELMGGTSATYPERYRAASPAHLPRYDIPLIVVSGDQDRIALSPLVEIYANALEKNGNNVKYFMVKNSGHFEMITPGTEAWSDIEKTVISLFK